MARCFHTLLQELTLHLKSEEQEANRSELAIEHIYIPTHCEGAILFHASTPGVVALPAPAVSPLAHL
jgi:hypothetical protein